MSKQPEALRLADALERGECYESQPCSVYGWVGSDDPTSDAATELRRLHAVNAELLEALQALLESERSNSSEIVGRDVDGHPLNAAGVARVQARAAIAKATGEQA
jgi:hypothetical protein